MNFEIENRKVDYGISADYYTMDDIIDPNIPEADFDYVDDLPF